MLYFLPLIACFGISIFIYKDKRGNYLAGGSTEVMIMFLVAFLPIANIIFSVLVIGTYLIEKNR